MVVYEVLMTGYKDDENATDSFLCVSPDIGNAWARKYLDNGWKKTSVVPVEVVDSKPR